MGSQLNSWVVRCAVALGSLFATRCAPEPDDPPWVCLDTDLKMCTESTAPDFEESCDADSDNLRYWVPSCSERYDVACEGTGTHNATGEKIRVRVRFTGCADVCDPVGSSNCTTVNQLCSLIGDERPCD